MSALGDRPYILVAEDDRAAALLLQTAAEEAEIQSELRVVREGQALLDTLRALLPEPGRGPVAAPPYLVLLDLNLPGVNGKQALRALRENPAFDLLPVVVMSGSERPEEIAECIRLGANSFIVKPLGVVELITLLRTLEDYWLNTVARSRLG